jgi:hypothetical protein
VDAATLHPLGALVAVAAAIVLLRLARRGFALHRRARLQRPPEAL